MNLHALTGDMRFNTDKQTLEIYDGNSWVVCDRAGRTSFDEEFSVRHDVARRIDEKVKEKALNELFGVK
jgi:hypothetical protein